MSVLSFPRIYFKGMMEWDPCTFNNNDFQEMPTYDGVNAALNWPYLAGFGITQQNFATMLRPWAIGLLPDCLDQPGGDRVPAEWNMFGTHGVSFVEHAGSKVSTVITSGALSPTEPITQDALIGGPVTILGDTIPGSKQPPGPGRLVDTNPASYWSSQIYFQHLSFGGDKCKIHGPRSARMHSRWLNLGRIYTGDSRLTQPAASVACCFQASIPYADVVWPAAGTSQLADKLNTAASQSPALGIMVRFTAYVNVYFKNGILNDIKTATPRDYKELSEALTAAWNEFNSSGSSDLFFSNPCYSHIVGTLGVWDSGEVETAPVGRFLSASTVLTPSGTSVAAQPAGPMTLGKQMVSSTAAAPAAPPVGLGPVVVYVDGTVNDVISIDLGSAIPETGTPGIWPSDLTKANFGPLTFGVTAGPNGPFTPIAQIEYDTQYSQSPYEASSGIVDIPLSSTIPGSEQTQVLLSDPNNLITIQVQQTSGTVIALQEQQLSAQTDRRGIYLDQNETATFQLTVYDFGQPSPQTNVLVSQYDQSLSLVPAAATPLVFLDGQQELTGPGGVPTNVAIVTTDANGVASVSISAMSPGYAVLAFQPYSGALPSVLPSLGAPPGTVNPLTYAFYTTVRVLPFDDGMPQRFVDLINATDSAAGQNPTIAWQFVYNQILYVYDMLFSVMAGIINLGNQQAVQDSIGSIWWAISKETVEENTLAMPITRDMSAGKRKTLQLWIYLVANGFKVQNFNVNSTQGWGGPGS